MYNSIKTYYNQSDISERKQQYYSQILDPNRRSISPQRTYQLKQVIQPAIFNSIRQAHDYKIPQMKPLQNSRKQNPPYQKQQPKSVHDKPIPDKSKFSIVYEGLKATDPERYQALRQRAEIYKKLEKATLGCPLDQNFTETQLLSNNYILPHYKSDKGYGIQQQQSKIKVLTAQIIENQTKIHKMGQMKAVFKERVDRIRQIDEEIYHKLDQDRTQQIQNYLRMAKNSLAEGESEEKIIGILKKILY